MYTPKTPKIDSNFDFPVLREPWNLSNGKPTKLEALYRGDTGDYLSCVSPDYVLTTHKEATDFVENMLAKTNVGTFELGTTSVSSHGNVFHREYRFPTKKFIPGEGTTKQTALDGGKLDEYMPMIIVRNSYNRQTRLEFTYGFYRLVCTNGMIRKSIDQAISIKHVKQPDFDQIGKVFFDRMEATIEGFKVTYERLNGLAASVFIDTVMLETLSKKMALLAEAMSNGLITLATDENENITGVEVNPQLSAYALYQIVTDVASHNFRKYHRALQLQSRIAEVFSV